MKRRICFFALSLTFNRLNRLKYYEKIFPKNVDLFLFTTDKSEKKQTKQYLIRDYGLKRMEIEKASGSSLALSFELRNFCIKNKIDKIINVGNHEGSIFLFIATLFIKTEYIVNFFGDLFNSYKYTTFFDSFLRLFTLLLLFPIVHLSDKIIFNDYENYSRARIFFFVSRRKLKFLPAPVDTNLFKLLDKNQCRKELGLPINKNIVLFAGRVIKSKGSEILNKLIEMNQEILFVIIGKIIDEDFKIKTKNFIHIEKKDNEELVPYYNAADLTFYLCQWGGGLGMVAEESLACGTPVIVLKKEYGTEKSKAALLVPFHFGITNKSFREFFRDYNKKSVREKEQLAKIARDFAQKNFAANVWERRYIDYYSD